MFKGIKDIVSFVYRKTIPSNPDAATIYWVESDSGTEIYFADDKKRLIRLDSNIVDIVTNGSDENIIVEKNGDSLTLKLKYGDFGDSDTYDGLATVRSIIQYFGNGFEVDKENNIVKFTKNGEVYYSPVKPFVNAANLDIADKIKYSTGGNVAFTVTSSDPDCDIYYTVSTNPNNVVSPKTSGTLIGETNTILLSTNLNKQTTNYYVSLQARSRESGLWSQVKTITCMIWRKLAKPTITFSPANNDYVKTKTISIRCSNCSDPTIDYTLNDGAKIRFSSSTSKLTRPSKSDNTYEIKAVASKAGWATSDWSDVYTTRLASETLAAPILTVVQSYPSASAKIRIDNQYDENKVRISLDNGNEVLFKNSKTIDVNANVVEDGEHPIEKSYLITASGDDYFPSSSTVNISFDLEKLGAPTIERGENDTPYMDSLTFNVVRNADNPSGTTYYYGYDPALINNVVNGGIIASITMKSTPDNIKPVTLYAVAKKPGYHSSDVAVFGPKYFGMPYMYWDVLNRNVYDITIPTRNVVGEMFETPNSVYSSGSVMIEADENNVTATDAYGRMVFAYDSRYGELYDIVDAYGNSYKEQFTKRMISDYLVYISSQLSVQKTTYYFRLKNVS